MPCGAIGRIGLLRALAVLALVAAPAAWAALDDQTASRIPPKTSDSYALAAGDVDGDTDVDLVAANAGGLTLLLNDGGGSFTDAAAKLPALSGAFVAAVLVDVDGDGDRDLVLANATGPARLLVNSGNGTFTDDTAARLPSLAAPTTDVAAVDFDRDGKTDLVFTTRGGATRVLRNGGGGVFTDLGAAALAPRSDRAQAIAAGDVNGDGAPDLVVAVDGGQPRIYLGNGLGAFTDATASALPAVQLPAQDVVLADVDGDRDLDLLFAAGPQGVVLWRNDGSGVFTAAPPGAVPALAESALGLAVGDVDFDGNLDVVVACAGQDHVLAGDGQGAFTDVTAAQLPSDASRSFAAVLEDLDGDYDLDLFVAKPGAQNRLFVNAIPFPRIRLSRSPDYIETGDTVTIRADVFDEDGLSSVALTVNGSPVPLVNGVATFAAGAAGPQLAVVTARDTLGNVGTRSLRYDVATPDVTLPQVTLGVTPPTLLRGQTVTIQASATDDRAVKTLGVTVDGAPIAIDTTGKALIVTSALGVHTVIATAQDFAGNVGTKSGTFEVLADGVLPVVTLTETPDPAPLATPVSIQIGATDNVSVSTLTLEASGPGIAGSQPIPIGPGGQASFTPYLNGSYTLTGRATDPSGNVGTKSVSFTATGTPDSAAPQVSISGIPGTVAINVPITITVTATDNVLVAGVTLTINGAPLSLVNGTATYTPLVLGPYDVVATATDPTGNVGTANASFTAVDPATDVSPPVVSIATPGDDAKLSDTSTVIGSVNDVTLASWTLSYTRVDQASYTTLATGTTAVTNGLLGIFDPTMLENGFYELRLDAQDVNGRASTATSVVEVTGNLKLGQFTLSFRDKNLDFGKIPIEVTRTYDSRRKDTLGDFGYGWAIDLNEVVAVENRPPGDAWRMDTSGGFFPTYTLVPDRPHTVSIQFPGQKELRFAAEPDPQQQLIVPIDYLNAMNYTPIGDTTGTLTPNDQPALFTNGQILDFNFEVFHPSEFTYRSDDGYVYVFSAINQNSLRHKLVSITDPSGVTLSLTPNGFTRSDGVGLAFVRDAQGRITKITDPNGGTITYQYDAQGNLVSFTDSVSATTTFAYDSHHYLTEVRDPLGRPTQRQEFGPDGRLTALTDAAGQRVEFSYDLGANSQIVRDRRGNPAIYEYDVRGNIVKETRFPLVNGVAQAVALQRTFDADNQPTSETNGLGMLTTFAYSNQGNVTQKVVDANGFALTTTSTYDAQGHILTQVDPLGHTVSNTYDADGSLLSRTDRDGGVTTYTLDTDKRVTRETDPLGNYTTYTYDAVGRKASEDRFTAANVRLRHLTYAYDANGNKLSETIQIGGTNRTTAWTYDKMNRVTSVTDPGGNVKRTEYDPNGNVKAEIDGLGRRTEYTYDARNLLTRTDYPDGTYRETTYDPDGNKATERDRNGNVTSYAYDALNRISRVDFADGSFVLRFYDAAGNLIGETDARGNRTDHFVDSVGRRVKTMQPAVRDALTGLTLRPTTLYEYDANGNRTALVDALGHRTQYSFDALDRETQVLLPGGLTTGTAYDLVGNVVSKTDAAGAVTQYAYDALKRLTKTTLPTNLATSYTYDEAGHLLTQTDANSHATRFTYDAAGNRIGRQLPGNQSESFVYDAALRMVRHVDFKGAGTDYGYDETGHQNFVRYSDASTVLTTYLGEGQPLTVTDARGVATRVYDARNRLTSAIEPGGAALVYTYDGAGNRTSVTAASGTTAYTYDTLNRLESVTDTVGGVTSYGYDLVGNLAQIVYPNGVTTSYVYNARNQLTSVTHRQGATVLASFAYTLDPNGLRTQVVEADGSTTTYTYDGVNRLVHEVRAGVGAYDVQYTYDPVGNRLTMNRNGAVTNYSYDVNDRLTQNGAESLSYDANGSLVSRTSGGQTTTYAYDVAGRLATVTSPVAGATTYAYDAAGNRVAKTDSGGTTRYLVDTRSPSGGLAQVLEERDGGGALLASYTRGLDLVSQRRSGTSSYYHADGLGSVRALTGDAGTVTDGYVYDAFGREITRTGTTVNPYRFAGEQLDANVGFYYLRARYYDPATGRFVSMDPELGDPQSPISLHRYLYANANPVNFTDPTGRQSLIEVSISISISTNIQSIYTTNLIKFFFKAAKIAYCCLAPAYKLQEMALDMIASDVPGGFELYELSQKEVAAAFQAIGQEIVETYKNIANEIVSVKVEVSGLLKDLYDAYQNGAIPVPVPEEVAKILEFKDKLEGWLDEAVDAYNDVALLATGDACNVFTVLDKRADLILKLVPEF